MNDARDWPRVALALAAAALIGGAVLALASRLAYMSRRAVCRRRVPIAEYAFQSGDLLLASDLPPRDARSLLLGVGNWTKVLTASAFNHVGVVYVEPLTRAVYVWEINGGGTRLATLHDYTCGRARQRLYVRALNKPLRDVHALERVIARQWNSRTFDFDMPLAYVHRYCWMVPPLLKGHAWGANRQRTCAHLTTECYQALGVLELRGSGLDPASLFPADYGRDQIDARLLPFANGYALGPLVQLEFCVDARNQFRVPPRASPDRRMHCT